MNGIFYSAPLAYSARFASSLIATTAIALTSAHIKKKLFYDQRGYSEFAKDRSRDIQALFRSAMIILSVGMAFGTSPSNIWQYHKLWLILELVCFSANIKCIQNITKNIKENKFITSLSKSITSLIKPILVFTNIKRGSFETALQVAVVEEILFRGVLQEGILRQLPRTIFATTSWVSPESVDLPAFRVMRIGLTALLFGIAHAPKGNDRIISCSLSGGCWSYLQEHFGLGAAIISHFANNFYVSYVRRLE